MGRKRRASAAADAPTTTRCNEYQAESLTGKRAISGRLPGGGPRYVYEVKWKDGADGEKYQNSFEPAEHLIEWAAEMKEVDDEVAAALKEEFYRPVKVANANKEAAAKKRAEKLQHRRVQLMRQQRRLSRSNAKKNKGANESEDDEDESDPQSEESSEAGEGENEQASPVIMDAAVLDAALKDNFEQLRRMGAAPAHDPKATPAPAINTETPAPVLREKKRKQGSSRVWLAFDFETQKCMLPHPQDSTRKCGAGPGLGTGTSGHRAHLSKEHASEWSHILMTGQVKTSSQMIAEALKAKVDLSTPPLGDKEREELHRLTALWISKCGRPQAIVEDSELRTLLARILDLCKARLRYEFPGRDTLGKHLMLLGQEGKTLGRDFLLRLIKSGVKPSITGDLWSESGMGLFGIYAHGITETWAMEKALIGLVACSAERHTAVNIKKWTEEALTAIGFNSKELLERA